VAQRRASRRQPKQKDDGGCGGMFAALALVLLWLAFFPFMVLAALLGGDRRR
jgi:hypothetical protein